jgi:hypothetical protein
VEELKMARNKIGLQTNAFKDLMGKLDELGGSPAMKKATESALKASKEYVNSQINKCMVPGNLPAGGKYSTGDTKRSIDTDMNVEWEGLTASIKAGFDFKKSGLKSIFLMHGTPKMAPVAGLKDAIYGAKTQKQIAKLQAEAVNKVVERIMGGK